MRTLKITAGIGTLLALMLSADGSHASTFKVLHTFGEKKDGSNPAAGLVADKFGSLYGTTESGGKSTGCHGFACGTVFKMAADGTESTLYSFQGGTDGALPTSRLFIDKTGNLYGTTTAGGGSGCGGDGCGTVFKITPEGTESIVYSFTGDADGSNPVAGVVSDKKGNLFGTTRWGGKSGCADGLGCGTVFKIAANGTKTTVYSFKGGNDGGEPTASLLIDKTGNLYGTTHSGGTGCNSSGCGTVFKISSRGKEATLHELEGGVDGAGPAAELVTDSDGNFYGTTAIGGGSGCGGFGCGTVFKIEPNGTTSVLYSFLAGTDGGGPQSGLIFDAAVNLYGTTSYGGDACGCGTISCCRAQAT